MSWSGNEAKLGACTESAAKNWGLSRLGQLSQDSGKWCVVRSLDNAERSDLWTFVSGGPLPAGGFVPSTIGYAYLMLSMQGVERDTYFELHVRIERAPASQ